MSSIWTFQDDKILDSSLKKNGCVSIFTTFQVASAYFERKSNNFSKHDRYTAISCINKIYSARKKDDYTMLAYIRDDPHPFRHTEAVYYGPGSFRYGCASLWKVDKMLAMKKNKLDFDNDPILSSFKIPV